MFLVGISSIERRKEVHLKVQLVCLLWHVNWRAELGLFASAYSLQPCPPPPITLSAPSLKPVLRVARCACSFRSPSAYRVPGIDL